MYIYRGKISWSDKFRNEAITVVFPSIRAPGAQVYLFSRWSTIPQGLNSKAFSAHGVVESSNNPSETTTTISFSHSSGPINLFATQSDNKLLLCIGDGVLAVDIATLFLVYQSDAYPRIYTGIANFDVPVKEEIRRAVDEPLLAISSRDAENGAERLLCVFTQWTETDTTGSANADFIPSAELNTTTVAPWPNLACRGFTFLIRQEDGGPQVLSVETEDTAFKSEVSLSSFSTQFKVTNNMSGFINCEVTTQEPKTDSFFEYGGYTLGAIGVLFAFASTGYGLAFAVGSYLFSNLPVIWNAGKITEARYTGMPPGDTFEFSASEDMYILVMNVKQSGQGVIVQYARQKYSTGGNVSIDSTLPWKPLVYIDQAVPTGRQMVTRGLLQLPNVRASMIGLAVNDQNNYVNMGIYSGNMNWSTEPLYHRAFREEYAGLPLLEYRDDWNACVAFSSLASGDCKVLRLSSSPYKPYVVLMLRFVQLQGADSTGDSTPITGAIPIIGGGRGSPKQTRHNLEANLLHAIQLDEGYRYPMYYFTPNNGYGRLRGVTRDAKAWSIIRLKKDENLSTYTLLRIEKPVLINPVYTLTS